MGGDVPLPGDGDGHENGTAYGDLVEGEKEVGEELDVDLGGQVKSVLESQEDGSQQVSRVKDSQGHQKRVERVFHLFPGRPIRCQTPSNPIFFNKPKKNMIQPTAF